MSKKRRSGSDRRSAWYLNSEETSMEMRVTSPSDQKRTEVTLPAAGAELALADPALEVPVFEEGEELPAADTTPVRSARAAATAAVRTLRRRSEMQSAIGVDKLLQPGVLLLFNTNGFHLHGDLRSLQRHGHRRRSSRQGVLGRCVAGFAVLLPHVFHVLPRFRIGRNLFEPVHRGRPCVVGGQSQAVVLK